MRLETGQVPWARHNYDAMLHWDGRDSRTIAFKKSDSGYLWIGEQEIFEGPHEYQGVDGYYHESITLNYDIEEISGFPINSLSIMYHGEDPRLADTWLSSLTLADVKPILKEWGC